MGVNTVSLMRVDYPKRREASDTNNKFKHYDTREI